MTSFDQWKKEDRQRARAAIADLLSRFRDAGVDEEHLEQLVKELGPLIPDVEPSEKE